MKKHWTSYLPEPGTIVQQGENQIFLLEKIYCLQKELDTVKSKYEQKEVLLHKIALKEWCNDEINEAKAKASTEEENSNLHPLFHQILKPFGIK